jgi:hypothetical protein
MHVWRPRHHATTTAPTLLWFWLLLFRQQSWDSESESCGRAWTRPLSFDESLVKGRRKECLTFDIIAFALLKCYEYVHLRCVCVWQTYTWSASRPISWLLPCWWICVCMFTLFVCVCVWHIHKHGVVHVRYHGFCPVALLIHTKSLLFIPNTHDPIHTYIHACIPKLMLTSVWRWNTYIHR